MSRTKAVAFALLIVGWVCVGLVLFEENAKLQRETQHQQSLVLELKARLVDQMTQTEISKAHFDACEDALKATRASFQGELKALLRDIEDIEWQMGIVVSTCPGRARPPVPPKRSKSGPL